MKYSLINKLTKIPYKLILIEDHHILNILDNFREFYSQSGTPVYIWKEGSGLYRTDLPHVKLPNTQSAQQVLQFIINNQTGYVYVLNNFSAFINNPFIINLLKKIHGTKNPVFLLDEDIDLPLELKGKALETKKMMKMKQRMETELAAA